MDDDLQIDNMYFEHDHPEVKGKSTREIHEYSLGHHYEEVRKQQEEAVTGLAAVICCTLAAV